VDKVGTIRRIELREGGIVRETLLALSDLQRTVVYDIIDSPMPVQDYIARIDLHEVTEGNKTFAHWSVEFEAPADKRKEMVITLQDIFRVGLLNLNQLLGRWSNAGQENINRHAEG